MSYLEGKDLKSIENLDLLAKQVVEGFIIGLHKSPFHGFSVEFAEHRIYNPGESTKNIDWKVYARTNKMFVKRYEEETNLRCQIVIDTSSSMYFPEDGAINKIQWSSIAASSLMNLLKRQRDAYGLTLFDNKLVEHTRAKSSTMHYQLLLTYLERLIKEDQRGKVTSTADVLHQVADSIHRRSLVVIFSDMMDDAESAEALFAAMQHLRYAKHEVILFHTVDKSKEIDFDYADRSYLFVDMESGDEVKLQANQVRDLYKNKVKSYQDELRMKCLQYKIEYVEADIQQGYNQVLQTYLIRRSKSKLL